MKLFNILKSEAGFEYYMQGSNPYLVNLEEIHILSLTVSLAFEEAHPNSKIAASADRFLEGCEEFIKSIYDQDLKGSKSSLFIMKFNFLILNEGRENLGGKIIPMPNLIRE